MQVRYLWAVEGYRRDVDVIDQHLLTALWFTRAQGHLFPHVIFPHRFGRLSGPSPSPLCVRVGMWASSRARERVCTYVCHARTPD